MAISSPSITWDLYNTNGENWVYIRQRYYVRNVHQKDKRRDVMLHYSVYLKATMNRRSYQSLVLNLCMYEPMHNKLDLKKKQNRNNNRSN